jgi:hypothetical protein
MEPGALKGRLAKEGLTRSTYVRASSFRLCSARHSSPIAEKRSTACSARHTAHRQMTIRGIDADSAISRGERGCFSSAVLVRACGGPQEGTDPG